MWKWGECRIYSDELMHWGILGQRWGIRRFQNSDGSLTAEGRIRYNKENEKKHKLVDNAINMAKKEKEYWHGMAEMNRRSLEELKTDKRKGDWYDTEEEKQEVVEADKAEWLSALEHEKDWDIAIKQLESMPVDKMPAEEVKKRTARNYISNAVMNGEDVGEGYTKDKIVTHYNIQDKLDSLAKQAKEDGKLGELPKEIEKDYKTITQNLDNIVENDSDSKIATDRYHEIQNSKFAHTSDINRAYKKAMTAQNYAIYAYLMDKYPKEKAELILVWLYETDKLG